MVDDDLLKCTSSVPTRPLLTRQHTRLFLLLLAAARRPRLEAAASQGCRYVHDRVYLHRPVRPRQMKRKVLPCL